MWPPMEAWVTQPDVSLIHHLSGSGDLLESFPFAPGLPVTMWPCEPTAKCLSPATTSSRAECGNWIRQPGM